MNKQKSEKSIVSLKSFGFALHGILQSIVTERNIRIHWIIAAITTALGIFSHLTVTEWCILFLFFALVIATEMINTAIEDMVDLISPELSSKVGKIKDIAGGAVLVSAVFAVIAGCLIFIPKFFA